MANNNNNNNNNNYSAISPGDSSAISPGDSSAVSASGGGLPGHVATGYWAMGSHYCAKPDASPIPTWVRDTVTGPHQRIHVAWEDRSTGSYCRYNSGVKCDGDSDGNESFRWYENAKVRDGVSGYEAKYSAEEKYEEKYDTIPHTHHHDYRNDYVTNNNDNDDDDHHDHNHDYITYDDGSDDDDDHYDSHDE